MKALLFPFFLTMYSISFCQNKIELSGFWVSVYDDAYLAFYSNGELDRHKTEFNGLPPIITYNFILDEKTKTINIKSKISDRRIAEVYFNDTGRLVWVDLESGKKHFFRKPGSFKQLVEDDCGMYLGDKYRVSINQDTIWSYGSNNTIVFYYPKERKTKRASSKLTFNKETKRLETFVKYDDGSEDTFYDDARCIRNLTKTVSIESGETHKYYYEQDLDIDKSLRKEEIREKYAKKREESEEAAQIKYQQKLKENQENRENAILFLEVLFNLFLSPENTPPKSSTIDSKYGGNRWLRIEHERQTYDRNHRN